MKFRTTLFLLLLAMGLLAFLVFYTLRRPGQVEYEATRDLLFPPAEVGGKLSEQAIMLRIARGGDPLIFSRSGPGMQDWRMTQPFDAPADRETIAAVLSALESLTPQYTILGERERFRRQWVKNYQLYGVGRSDWEDRFSAGALSVGFPTPDGKSFYGALVDGDKPDLSRIFVLPNSILNEPNLTADDFRDKTLLRFDPATVDRLTLAPPQGAPAELRKTAAGWECFKPASDYVEDTRITELLGRLSARVLEKESFTGLDPAACGLDKPLFVISVREGEKTATLRIGASAPDGKDIYVSRDGDPGVILLDSAFFGALIGNIASIQSRRALPFRVEEATALDISGPVPMRLQRGGAGWQWASSGKAADPDRVRVFLRRLSELEIKERINAPGDEEVAQKGLREPRWKVRVETPHGTRELRFGGDVSGSALIYARRGDSGPILSVPDFIIEMLKAGEAAFAARPVALDLRKENILSIRIESQGKTTLLVRNGNDWTLANTDSVTSGIGNRAPSLNKDAVAALLLDLALVEAVEALPSPAQLSECGLDKPRATVTISIEGPPPAERKLILGHWRTMGQALATGQEEGPHKTAVGDVYAMNQDGHQVFVVDASILKSLQRELVER